MNDTTTKGNLRAKLRLSPQRALLLITIFAFLLSVTLAIWKYTHDWPGLANDAIAYDRLAKTILHKHSYEGCFWPPGYPAFIAVIYAVAGHSPLAVFIVQSALFALTLPFVYKIARYVTVNEYVAIITVAICSVWPTFLKYTSVEMTEIFSGFLIAVALWLILRIINKHNNKLCIGAGILLGIAVLTKPIILPFALVSALFVFIRKDFSRRLIPTILLLVSVGAVVLPWTIRNYVVTGEIVPVSANGGINLWLSNWQEVHDHGWTWGQYPHPLDKELTGKNEIEQDRILRKAGATLIIENPVKTMVLAVRKFSGLWLGGIGKSSEVIKDESIVCFGNFAIPAVAVIQVPIFILALLGWFMLPRQAKQRANLLLALMVFWTVSYVMTSTAMGRFAVPVEYYKIFFASIAICQIVGKIKPLSSIIPINTSQTKLTVHE